MKKQMVKRLLAAAVAVMMMASLAACGGDDATQGTPAGDQGQEAPAEGGQNQDQDQEAPAEGGQEDTGAPAEKPTAVSEIQINKAGTDATGNLDGSAEPEGIQPGTIFRYWTNYDIPLYAPWKDNRAAALSYQIYDNLLIKYKGDRNDIRCNIAKDYQVSEDGLVWTFQLREDVTFSDGCGLTAQDFIATWDVMQKEQPRPFACVDKYEANGDYELVITLKAPNPTFIYELPTQSIYGVVCHEKLEQFGPDDNGSAVGCGPYYVESYETGSKFVLKAREDYWNEEKMPHIETCELVIIPDENTAMMGLMTGDLDCMNTVDIEVMNNLVANEITLALIEDRENPFWLNGSKVDCLKDIRVREALCHMVDWEALSQLVYDGLYPHPNSYFTGEHVAEFSDKYTYDPDKGLSLLEEAGYKPEDIKFTILADPDFTNLEVAMVAQFNELGLTGITTETFDGATCYGMLKAGDYECFPCHNGYDPESPLTPFTMGLLEGGSQPCMFLKAVDEAAYNQAVELYDKAAASPTVEEFNKNIVELEDLVQEQCLALGGLQVIRGYAFADHIRGAFISPVSAEIQMCHLWVAE